MPCVRLQKKTGAQEKFETMCNSVPHAFRHDGYSRPPSMSASAAKGAYSPQQAYHVGGKGLGNGTKAVHGGGSALH